MNEKLSLGKIPLDILYFKMVFKFKFILNL